MKAPIPFISKSETVEANILRRTGEVLRSSRQMEGITLENASQLVGISPHELWLWEVGRKSPPANTFYRLSCEYGAEAIRNARILLFQLQIERYYRYLTDKTIDRKLPAVIYRQEGAA